jgi:hypothetical protein
MQTHKNTKRPSKLEDISKEDNARNDESGTYSGILGKRSNETSTD